MAKSTPQNSVDLIHPDQYPFSCMANRYAVIKEDGFKILHFGLLNSKDDLLDQFTCICPEQMLLAQKDNIIQFKDKVGVYIEQSGHTLQKIPRWDAPLSSKLSEVLNIPVVDFIHLAHADLMAEFCFWNYSQGTVGDQVISGRRNIHVKAWGVGMVRCSLDLQRALLDELY